MVRKKKMKFDEYEEIDFATKYAKQVVNGEKMACEAEINVCKRHLKDLERARKHEDGLEWHPEIAVRHIELAEKLKFYNKNEKKYEILKLRGFQKFIIASLFGWYKNGIRRFTESFVEMARKNGKSFLCAFLAFDFSTLSAIKDGQIYTAGTNFYNASIVWNDVKKTIEGNKQLEEYFQVKDYRDSRSVIINKKNGTNIIPLSGTTDKDGFLPLCAVVDEYHLHDTDEMYNVLLDGQVGLHGSLTIAITTAGFNLNSPAYAEYKYSKQVAKGTITADNLFVYIAEMDLPDPHKQPVEYEKELWNKENWAKANPLLLFDTDTTITTDENKWIDFSNKAEKARKQEGSVLRDFLTKQLNVWTTLGSEAYISEQDFGKCAVNKTLQAFIGKKCYAGIDLSSKNDLSTFSFVFPEQEGVEKPYIYSHSFLPKATVPRHIRTDKVPYDTWNKRGLITFTDLNGKNGYILDYRAIFKKVRELIEKYHLKVIKVGYDPMGISAVLADLEDIFEAEAIEIGQYPKSMNDTTRHFRSTVQGHGIEYDYKNELLVYSIVNAEAVLNSKDELIIDKKNVNHRIDPVDCILDAWKCMLLDKETESQAEKDERKIDEWIDLMNKL